MSRSVPYETLPVRDMGSTSRAAESSDRDKAGQGGSVAVLQRKVMNDGALVEALLAGHAPAVAELFDRYAYVVRGVFVRALGGPTDLEDLMQDAFLVIVRRIGTLRDPEALRSFVVSVAVRIARNELRRRAFRQFIGFDEVIDPPVTPAHDPEAAEAVRRVYEVLSRLDTDSRLAFVVRHLEGYELTQAAEICGCSLATIKRRLVKAEKCFEAMSRNDPVLSRLLETGRVGS
jgi:RNA polymerase sigma-70 factor (ECF subfamily)